MKKLLFVVAIAAIAFWGCNKSQKVVCKLEGGWTVSSMTVGGSATAYVGIGADTLVSLDEMLIYKFTSCKVKKDSCYGEVTGLMTDSVVDVIRGVTYPFNYIVEKDKLTMFIDFGNGSEEVVEITVKDQSKDELIIEYTAGGATIEATLVPGGTIEETTEE